MKKIISVLVLTALILTFTAGCSSNKRELYSKTKLSKYVKLENYMGLEIDTATSEFKGYYDSVIEDDIYNNAFYNKVTDGIVADGDTVNIDYEGKKDGVAFEGGTDKNYDLTIGSGTFIDGFEDGLIGVSVGSTVDLYLKFPAGYHSQELAGESVVFTVTINHVYKNKAPEEYYSELHFDSLKDYEQDVKKRAAENYLLSIVTSNAAISEYPEKEAEILGNQIYEFHGDAYETTYGVNIEYVLESTGYTVESYKEMIAKDLVPELMHSQMVMYYILDQEKLKIDEDILDQQNIEQQAIAESYAVQEIVLNYLYENAIIK